MILNILFGIIVLFVLYHIFLYSFQKKIPLPFKTNREDKEKEKEKKKKKV